MLIDGHAYTFPPLDAQAGYSSLAEKMRAVQRELGGHHQPVWRVKDRARAENSVLIDPETGEFHKVIWGRDNGRLVWTHDGETYTKQYLPPMLHNLEMPPEVLIAEMDYAGVDMAILHSSPHLGQTNELHRQATVQFPDRLRRLVSLPGAEIPKDVEAAVQEVERQVAAGGVCGYQFPSRYYWDGGYSESWEDGPMRPFWEAVSGLGLPVYFTLQARRSARSNLSNRDSYLEEHRTLGRWIERYPDTKVVITHGLQWLTFLEGDRIELPEEVWEVFESPNCHMQLLFPIQLGGIWEYPFKNAEPTVKECVERIGSNRLIFGSDMPMVGRFCTYRQAIDQYRVHCDFLSGEDRKNILGGTVARLLGLKDS